MNPDGSMRNAGVDHPELHNGFTDKPMRNGRHGTLRSVVGFSGFRCVRKRMYANEDTERQLRMLDGLTHPHLVKILASIHRNEEFAEVGAYCQATASADPVSRYTVSIFMERCECNLRDMLNKMISEDVPALRLSPTEAMKKLGELLLGVDYLHMNNMCHNNINPTNILVGSDGRLKLADFSLLSYNNEFNRFGDDSLYSPPEHTINESMSRWTTDIYSCAVVFGEMLTRQRPSNLLKWRFEECRLVQMPVVVQPSYRLMIGDRRMRPKAAVVLKAIFMDVAWDSPSKSLFLQRETNSALHQQFAGPEAEIARLNKQIAALKLDASGMEGSMQAQIDHWKRRYEEYRDSTIECDVCSNSA